MLRFSVGCLAKWWHFLGRSETLKVFSVWQLMTQLMTFWYILIMPTGPFQTRTFGSSKPRNENIIHLAVDEPVAPSVGINWNLRYHIWCQEHSFSSYAYPWVPADRHLGQIFHVKSMMICQFIMSSVWVHWISPDAKTVASFSASLVSTLGRKGGMQWVLGTLHSLPQKVDSGRYSIPHGYFLWIFLWLFLWVYGWSKTS